MRLHHALATGLVAAATVGCDAPAAQPAATGAGAATTRAATTTSASVMPPSGATSASASPTASAEAPVDPKRTGVVAGPYAAAKVADAVNPKHEAAYAGPTGIVKGIVRITGDAAPGTSFTFPAKCGEASATHGRLFRTGQGGTLADALVTVTGYAGFVPEVHEAKSVSIHGCALSKRTIAMTFGQRLEVANTDTVEAYMPYLDGAPGKAIMVAVPGGPPVKLYPTEPAAQYRLRDQLDKTWLVGDVFVLKFPTHDVTSLDGKYEITRVPVGKVRVNAYLPAIEWRVEKELDVKEGDNVLDFELTWKRGAPDAGAPTK
jgi:hypothetical protein